MGEKGLDNVPVIKRENTVRHRFVSTRGAVWRRNSSGKLVIVRDKPVESVAGQAVEENKVVVEEPCKPDSLDCAVGKFVLSGKSGSMFPGIGLMERSFLFGCPFRESDVEVSFGLLDRYIGKKVLLSCDHWEFSSIGNFNFQGFSIVMFHQGVIQAVRVDNRDGSAMVSVEPPLEVKSISFLVTDEEANKLKFLNPKLVLVSGVLNIIHNPVETCSEIVQLRRFV